MRSRPFARDTIWPRNFQYMAIRRILRYLRTRSSARRQNHSGAYMLRRPSTRFAIAVLLTVLGSPAVRALRPISADEAPKADAKLLRALNQGGREVRVIVGLRDGTPSARALLAAPDAAGEPARRGRRVAAQKRLSEEVPQSEFRVRHFYESFSLLAGRATRDGVLRLSKRADVGWITLDGKRRAFQTTPQAAATLMRSDQANAGGATGAGRSVAVIDTGVDYTVLELGGGGFPNAKVIGGFDTADEDSDPMDCDGHGTAVSGIVAGPAGVAPDSKIVAIKVFASSDASNSTCSDFAFVSDILQGINFAILHKAEFNLAAINLSLGGGPDSDNVGYCDSSEPAEAAAFDAAAAADLPVVASAGNGGFLHALGAPACVSSAVSVGAVYSLNASLIAWSDCIDAPVAPDLVTCFSNSNTNLSLLAPGAFWSTVRKGGGAALTFAGTSAAAPAAAGAIALLRQARPDLSGFGAVGVLRSTGSPVTDPRNGINTPRVDAFAAVQLPAASFGASAGNPVSIPDGAGSAVATLTLPGPGLVEGVRVWAQIDHDDPRQLRVTVSGPDGTPVLLHDQTGALSRPINAVYGLTDTPAQPLSAFQGRPANGIWTLTVEDLAPGTPGRIRNFSVAVTVAGTSFYTVAPCRIADTRDAAGPRGGPSLLTGTSRNFPLAGVCGIPPTAAAVAVNITVVSPASDGHLTVYPAAGTIPLASVINFRSGIVRANNAIVSLGASGQLAFSCVMISGSTDLVLDVTGYFE
ncbi:MAG TPA: S8 family serine peptidase [Thermoanaerobaculia bacterium]|nr:S8 family serine peptidase [Thermoanaerobaculia bacterium]